MAKGPVVRKPSRADMVRSMNRELLLGLLIPGPDRFEVRGWVKWLIGHAPPMPEDPVDRARFDQLRALGDEAIDALRQAALAQVQRTRGIEGSGAYQRGVEGHDRLMRFLLEQGNLDSVHMSAFISDVDRLLAMIEVDPADLEDEEFMAGFRWANHTLATEMAAAIENLA